MNSPRLVLAGRPRRALLTGLSATSISADGQNVLIAENNDFAGISISDSISWHQSTSVTYSKRVCHF